MLYPFSTFSFGPLFDGGGEPPPPPPKPADPYPGALWGFAHPSEFLGDIEPYGFGFGDPSDLIGAGQQTTPAMFGFGAPYEGYLDPAYAVGGGIAGTPDGLPWFADNGGDIMQLAGPWPAGTDFRIKVVNQDTGTVYPNDPTKSLLGLRGAKPGSGVTLRTTPDGLLSCSLCPLPPGVYDVEVRTGPGFSGTPYTITDAFRIVYRYYSREAWNIRSATPSHWRGMGPRALAAEPMPGNNSTFPQLNYRSLTAAIAEDIQEACGKAVTRLTQEVVWDLSSPTVLHVETTLGFPDNGSIYVGQWEYSYTGRTPDTFTGCFPKRVYANIALSPGEIVIAKPASWLPVN